MKKFLILLFALFHVGSISYGQWTQQDSHVSALLTGVWFTSPTNGWAVGLNGTILHTTDGGSVWTVSSASPVSSNLNEVAFIDSLRGFIVGDGNLMLATVDGGASWQFACDGNYVMTYYYGISISKSAMRAWVAGGRQTIGLSTVLEMRFGYTTPQYQEYTGRCVGVDFIDDQVGWISGMERLIMKTTDGGVSWTRQAGDSSSGYTGLNSIRFFDSEVGLAAGDSGVILRTTDGGANWHTVRKNSEVLFAICLRGDSTAYVVGSESAILVTTDRGASWQQQTTPLAGSITLEGVFFSGPNEGWVVGENGTILHTTNGGRTAVSNNADGLPDAFSLRANYPNPFNPSTTLEYEIGRASYVSIKLYDVTGKEVETLYEGQREPGRYTLVWNADRFASGVYHCRLSAIGGGAHYSEEQKVVLLK